MISIKFLLVISMLCKTEWSWELRTWSRKMNLHDILSTSPHYFCRKWMEQQMRIQILNLGFKGLIIPHHASRISFCLLEWGGEKEVLPESRQTFEVVAAQTSGLVNLVFSRQTGFFGASFPFIVKPLVITEAAVVSARLLGLGSKLYGSNMPRMLNKDLTQFMLFLSWLFKSSKQKNGFAWKMNISSHTILNRFTVISRFR